MAQALSFTPAVRPIPGYPGFEASEDGQIRRVGAARWHSQHTTKVGGYQAVGLWIDGRTKVCAVHRLVALAFLGEPPPGRNDCAHFDGDKANNHYRNLRWASRQENEADKVRHGRSNRGQRNGRAKVTDAQARAIREMGAGAPRGAQRQIAARFGISQGAVSNIVHGKRHAHG